MPLVRTPTASSNGNEEESKLIGQAQSDESSYSPPSFLQEQVEKLEQILERENWIKLSERSKAEHGNTATSSSSDDTIHKSASSMMFDMEDEDDFGSIRSNQSLKEELEWAELELGISLAREINMIGHEASPQRKTRNWGEGSQRVNDIGSTVDKISPALNGRDTTAIVNDKSSSNGNSQTITESIVDTAGTAGACTNTFDPTIPSEAMTLYIEESYAEQGKDFRIDAESRIRGGHSTEKHQEDSYCDSIITRRILRVESILVVSGALLAASMFLGGGSNTKQTQPIRFKPFHAY
ncbi:MAG: hypothetical protein SGBAC_010995 [Bacillariaceae sp.]